MYKCTECGNEYDVKPEFCDCGNDVFEEVFIETEKTAENLNYQNETVEQMDKKDLHKQTISNAGVLQTNTIPKVYESFDFLSVGIFLLCIFLSFIIICFAWNPKEQTTTNIKNIEVTEKEIPNIDTFWDNSIPVALQDKNKEIKKSNVTQIQSPKTKAIAKTNTLSKPKTNINKPSQKILKPKQETMKVSRSETIQKKVTPIKDNSVTIQEQNKLKDEQALVDYKINLRNTLGRKIDFTQVVGDGDCSVSFKVSSNGNIINRSFSKQSENITLNDVVYRAVMSVPIYNPPPKMYNNETMTLYVKIYNGNFEIELK